MRTRRYFLRVLGGMTLFAILGQRSGSTSQKAKKATMDATQTTVSSQAITLFLCGDVMTGRGIDQILPYPSRPHLYEQSVTDARGYVGLAEAANGPIAKPVDFAYIWGDTLVELRRVAPDVRIINLETAVTDSEDYLPKGINYRMHPLNIPCITAAGIDCCALANNHVLDWGAEGLGDTLDTLQRAGLKYAGAGRNLDQASAPAILPVPGKGRVLVFSFGSVTSGIGWDWGASGTRSGINLLPDLSAATVNDIARLVSRYRQPGDIVVASIHWGGNWGYVIPAAQRAFAHALIDRAHVDVLHGHSSHHVKGIEVYKQRPIVYGCGDFLNDYEGIRGYEAYRDDLGLMYFPSLDPQSGRLLKFVMTPTRIRKLQVARASSREAAWLADVLNREGRPLGTHVSMAEDSRLVLHWSGT